MEIGGGAKGIDGLLVECCPKQLGRQITLCLQQGVSLFIFVFVYVFNGLWGHCHGII